MNLTKKIISPDSFKVNAQKRVKENNLILILKGRWPEVDFIKAKSWAQSYFTLCAELLRRFFRV